MSKLKAKDVLGKKIEWEYAHDPRRGTCLVHNGTVTEIRKENILVGGTWRYLPDLRNVKIL